MTIPERCQQIAQAMALKLGLAETITVRWLPPTERVGPYTQAHVHTQPTDSRGTICLIRGRFNTDAQSLKELMAHELAHFKGHHGTKRFLAAVGTLAPKSQEARAARRIGALPHRHVWKAEVIRSTEVGVAVLLERCHLCSQTRLAAYTRSVTA